jgi:hypothetical protein
MAMAVNKKMKVVKSEKRNRVRRWVKGKEGDGLRVSCPKRLSFAFLMIPFSI